MNVGTKNIVKSKNRTEKNMREHTYFYEKPYKGIDFYFSICYNKKVLQGRYDMAITYRKLWKLLIDRKIKKGELQKLANISGSSIAKLGRNENVNTDILLKICQALNCNISEIMEIEKEEGDSNV